MTNQDKVQCIKDQKDICQELWEAGDEIMKTRINGMDKALEVKAKSHVTLTALVVTGIQIIIQGIFLLIWLDNK